MKRKFDWQKEVLSGRPAWCCVMNCNKDAVWVIEDQEPQRDPINYTHSCDEHIATMLDEGKYYTVFHINNQKEKKV